ncbi:hypothetical protein K7A41_09405 [Sphingobacterium sp. InxBP1]|uniref:hypothetical protein n=1 Tax=Sphingobacterium sp. InxBP1 TaxID=2870328 RepID=UPI00224447BB|nr:hypothetical protein [Sphingobacterium sp. InxBP1]MCW8311439.1 hypothetical protein [Sphingobacterium sp. InxBP1]
MKRFVIISFLVLTAFISKAQTYLNHGIGVHIGFDSDSKKSISPEYELSFLKNESYVKGIVTGIGASFPLSKKLGDERVRGYYVKGGYRLSNLSFGANAGLKTEDDFNNTTGATKKENSFLAGGWVAYNVIPNLKISVGADNFNGFKIGLIFLPATISSNR